MHFDAVLREKSLGSFWKRTSIWRTRVKTATPYTSCARVCAGERACVTWQHALRSVCSREVPFGKAPASSACVNTPGLEPEQPWSRRPSVKAFAKFCTYLKTHATCRHGLFLHTRYPPAVLEPWSQMWALPNPIKIHVIHQPLTNLAYVSSSIAFP